MSSAAPTLHTPSLAGRVALITGASSGIGAATARLFAVAGAKLVLSGRDEKRLQAVADSIRAQTPGAEVATLTGDIGEEATNKALVELALSRFGALHIAFNNAGLVRPGKLADAAAADVDLQLNSNVKSVVFGLKYQLPAIAKSSSADSWGVVLNNSSVVATRVKESMLGMAVYSATKAAVDTLTRFGALEGAAQYVRVNAVNPGVTRSEGALDLFGGADAMDASAAASGLVPKAMGLDELARFVLFLADNTTGRFFTGSTLLVDGGYNTK